MSTGYEPTVGVHDPTVSADATAASGERPDLIEGACVGRYVVAGVIGRGGMGVVYAAHDPTLARRVALKLLHTTDQEGAERLVREAQALAKLSDPRVVAIYDAGEHDDQVFIAMQLVDGETLATALATRKPTRDQILAWYADAGRGLAAAHAAGLVHRDFKPSNVLIDQRGHVAVTDFGLARSAAPDGELPRLTALGSIAGTPAYMSPEQHGQEAATQASDQFSFCVSLWEALFGQHPFVEGPRESMSPFAIGYAIYDGPLISPPRSDVPRPVIDALTRGLARDPAARWPSMAALLEALAPPPPRRRMWPLVVAGVALTGGAGAAAWLIANQLAGTKDEPAQSCAERATERVRGVWSETSAKQLAERFSRSTKAYAETAAANAAQALDRYAQRWAALHADACTVDRVAPASELAIRRGACLDSRLAALSTVARILTSEDRAELVERAHAVVAGLPDLADCSDATSLLAGAGRLPAELAAKVEPLELELTAAIARGNGGEYERAKQDLAAIAKRADDLGWAPLSARAHLALGLQQLKMLEPARDQLVHAAGLATSHHLDRDASRAWNGAVQAAGFEKSADAVMVLAPMARATAARVGEITLQVRAEIAYGRALVRLRKWKDGSMVCRAALETARTKIDGHDEVDLARDCLLEALVPLGATSEVEPLLVELIADRGRRLGADHPTVSDYLGIQVGLDLRNGKLAEAREKGERVIAIRRRAYPPRHIKIAEALHKLGDIAAAEAKPEAKQLYEEALAIALDAKPEPLVMINGLRQGLGYMAQVSGDHAAARKYFDDAISLTRSRVGSESLELAFLLLNYGQIRAEDNIDVGIGLVGEAHAILERANDKRVHMATAVLALLEIQDRRYKAARELLEEALAHAQEADIDPPNLGLMKYSLARTLVETRGDRKRARKLALEAKALFAKGGPAHAKRITDVDAWLAKQRLK